MKDNNNSNTPRDQFPLKAQAPANSVSVYTVLRILVRMKRELGLEAMLEYLDEYLNITDRHNPALKPAVDKALNLLCVRKMHRDAIDGCMG